ncbi:hypothetical protein BCR44DRAFT_224403 [Catenaria anguillulae PL171]|uniref:Uncharacterized protein n=1 Tax=Catenaria anguillulae PL171 TaxID=765915 RepID=A0A1Y2H402_9FUNG|nr:hypothetical protein BCR44DRAFT_224403 [Catenaria anguillulae PL171]
MVFTAIGRANFRAFVAKSKVARIAVAVCGIQAIIQLILESIVAVFFVNQLSTVPVGVNADVERVRKLAGALSVYHGIYILAALWQPFLTMDSIAQQNSIQLIIVLVLNGGLFGYAVVQYMQETSAFNELRTLLTAARSNVQLQASPPASLAMHILSIAVSSIFMFTTLYWTWKLRSEYNWAIYRKVGADRGTRKRLTVYFVLMMLLKLDVFFYFTFAVQFLVILYQATGELADILIHVGVSLVMIPILYFFCVRGIKTENQYMTMAFMAGTLGALGYLIDKQRQVLVQARFDSFRRSLSFAIIGCIVMAIITFVVSYRALRNFGLGLQQQLANKDGIQTPASSSQVAASKSAGGPTVEASPTELEAGNGGQRGVPDRTGQA